MKMRRGGTFWKKSLPGPLLKNSQYIGGSRRSPLGRRQPGRGCKGGIFIDRCARHRAWSIP